MRRTSEGTAKSSGVRLVWACEITDPHPTLGGKVVKAPFAYKAHAELYGRDEISAAAQLGFPGCTFRVYRTEL